MTWLRNVSLGNVAAARTDEFPHLARGRKGEPYDETSRSRDDVAHDRSYGVASRRSHRDEGVRPENESALQDPEHSQTGTSCWRDARESFVVSRSAQNSRSGI